MHYDEICERYVTQNNFNKIVYHDVPYGERAAGVRSGQTGVSKLFKNSVEEVSATGPFARKFSSPISVYTEKFPQKVKQDIQLIDILVSKGSDIYLPPVWIFLI